jgi:hypothetical protein
VVLEAGTTRILALITTTTIIITARLGLSAPDF